MLKVNIAGVEHAYKITDNRVQTNRAQTDTPTTASVNADAINDRVTTSDDETLVFIHGWLLSQSYWQPLVEQLSTRYRCLTYDLRGFGESERDLSNKDRRINLPAGRTLPTGQDPSHSQSSPEQYVASVYSLAAYAQDLGQLLSKLNIKQAQVIGHSLGGSIALWTAYLFPEQVKGVICINAGGGIYIPKEFEKFRSAGQQMVKFRPNWLLKIPLLPRAFARLMVKQPLSLQWGQQRIRDFIRADITAAEGSLLETTTEAEVHLLPQVIKQITQPVHFITATEDTVMPPRYVRYLASFHPDFSEEQSVSEIANCGHMAMVEQPQLVAEVIESVLSETA